MVLLSQMTKSDHFTIMLSDTFQYFRTNAGHFALFTHVHLDLSISFHPVYEFPDKNVLQKVQCDRP